MALNFLLLGGIILVMLTYTVGVLKKDYSLPAMDKNLKHFYPYSHGASHSRAWVPFSKPGNYFAATLKSFAHTLYVAFNPVQLISAALGLLCNFGVHDQLKPYEIRRVKIFNYCNSIGFVSALIRLFYLRCFAITDYAIPVLAINALPMVVCTAMAVCIILHRYKTAIVIFFSCFPPVLATMIFFTNDNGLEIYLLLFILFSFFFLHRLSHIIGAFSWILVCFLWVTFGDRPAVAVADLTLSVINYGTAFLLLFITLYFIKFEVWKYEKSLKQKKKELLRLNTVKDKVFSVISHDMRTPIASAIMLMRALEDESCNTAEFAELLPQLRSSMEETENLLANLLLWARNQIEHTEMSVSAVSMAAVTAQTMQSLHSNAAEKNIRLINEVPDSCYALVDEKSMEIVLRNLLCNAIKFTTPGGYVKMYSAVINDTTITITVADNGVGIPYDKQPLLLSNNYYTSLGTNKERGTGLGLLICKDLVEKNGGTLLFASEPGYGTSFTISLPVKQ